MKQEKWNNIARFVSKENITEDREESDLLTGDDEMQRLIHRSESDLKKTDLYLQLKKYDAEKAWRNKIEPSIKQSVFSLLKTWQKVAAIFIIALLTGSVFFSVSNNNQAIVKTEVFDVSAPVVTLPDGSLIKLNRASEVNYNKKFDKREIHLSGEAYFDIQHDAEKPFVIHVTDADITVLGTSFNVNALNNSNKIEVFVTSGKVELKSFTNTPNNAIYLTAGEKGIFDRQTGLIFKKEKQVNELAWITREIEFEQENLTDVLTTLNHVYGVSFNLDKSIPDTLKLTARFEKKDLGYILDIIAMTHQLKIEELEENKYSVLPMNQ